MFFKGKRERTRDWLLISGLIKPTLILLWEFEDEGKQKHQLPGLFPSPHAAQQAVKSTEVRARKLGNVPWAPREEIRNKSGFPQFTNTVSKLCSQGCVCILRAVSSVWVLQEADIKVHQGLDLQRCTGGMSVKDKRETSSSRQGKPGEYEQEKGKQDWEGRAIDCYTVLRKS